MRFLTAAQSRLPTVLAVLSAAMVTGWAAIPAAAQQPFDGQPVPGAQDAPPYDDANQQPPASDSAAARLGFKTLGEVSMDLQDSPGRLPENYAKQALADAGEEYQGPGYMRSWAGFDFYWLASGVCHRPLYFEEIYLERHGYNFGCAQPLVSAAHFFGRIPTLPYMMVVDPPCECVYPLGHYRPGSCAPFRYHVAPLRADAGLVEAGVITGLVFLVP